MERILISPPFGSYISTSNTTSVWGSYTLNARSGRITKTAQFFLDNLLYPVQNGYRNRIGLRNNGVYSIRRLEYDKIYSIVGLEDGDWEDILAVLSDTPRDQNDIMCVELNLGCPNVHEYGIRREIIKDYRKHFYIIAKLPPTNKFFPMAEMCAEEGIDFFHCSNTFPSEFGGISGYPLKEINLPLITELAKKYPGIPIIGGGGIYSLQDILDYQRAGATYYSISTVWLKPIKAYGLLRQFRAEAKLFESFKQE